MEMSPVREEQTEKADVGRDKTQILKELEEQPYIISSVQEALTELEKRLVGILRNTDDPDGRLSENSESILVPVAEQLHSHNAQLIGVHRKLVNILDRLEL